MPGLCPIGANITGAAMCGSATLYKYTAISLWLLFSSGCQDDEQGVPGPGPGGGGPGLGIC